MKRERQDVIGGKYIRIAKGDKSERERNNGEVEGIFQ